MDTKKSHSNPTLRVFPPAVTVRFSLTLAQLTQLLSVSLSLSRSVFLLPSTSPLFPPSIFLPLSIHNLPPSRVSGSCSSDAMVLGGGRAALNPTFIVFVALVPILYLMTRRQHAHKKDWTEEEGRHIFDLHKRVDTRRAIELRQALERSEAEQSGSTVVVEKAE